MLDYHVIYPLSSLLEAWTNAIEKRASGLLISRHSFHSNICWIIREVYPPHACSIESCPLRRRLRFVSIRVLSSDERGPVRLDCRDEGIVWCVGSTPDRLGFSGVRYAQAVRSVFGGEDVPAICSQYRREMEAKGTHW
jgi:hypothetical protein